MKRLIPLLLCAPGFGACVTTEPGQNRISVTQLRDHVVILASDALGGRAPGTLGGEKTAAYIAQQFREVGLCPAFAEGWFQEIPMLEAKPLSWRLSFHDKSGEIATFGLDDLALYSGRREQHVMIEDSALVFVGYGISAPDLGRDDYAGIDVRGKAVVMLAGTPDVPAFRTGGAPFRYGSALSKGAEAGRRGADAILIVTPDGEPWRQAAAAARDSRVSPDPAMLTLRPIIEGRLARSAADRLFPRQHPLSELEHAAGQPGFRAVSLGFLVSGEVLTDIRHFTASNVAAVLPGVEHRSGHIIFTAHWDHFGVCAPDSRGDRICNGAVDNASGVASLIELARVFAAGGRLQRSVLFLAVTGEEYGFIGSNYYVEHPALPLTDAVGGGNLDMTVGRERGTDVVLFGGGLSDIDEFFERAAKAQNRRIVSPRPEEANYFELSDNIVFVRKGVPLLTATGLWAEGPGRHAFDEYEAQRYHKPSDEVAAIASFEGAAEDAEFMHLFGRELGNSDARPAWRAGAPHASPLATASTIAHGRRNPVEWTSCTNH